MNPGSELLYCSLTALCGLVAVAWAVRELLVDTRSTSGDPSREADREDTP